jgi:hypothetical protein
VKLHFKCILVQHHKNSSSKSDLPEQQSVQDRRKTQQFGQKKVVVYNGFILKPEVNRHTIFQMLMNGLIN